MQLPLLIVTYIMCYWSFDVFHSVVSLCRLRIHRPKSRVTFRLGNGVTFCLRNRVTFRLRNRLPPISRLRNRRAINGRLRNRTTFCLRNRVTFPLRIRLISRRPNRRNSPDAKREYFIY